MLSQDVSDVDTSRAFASTYEDFDASNQALLDTFEAQVLESPSALLAALGKAYCANPGMSISGDQKDSSGTLDPIFWTIHPTMERLYQYRVLRGVGFESHAWPDNDACSGARADIAIPDRAAFVFGYTADSTADALVPGGPADVCMGHMASSRMYCGNPERTGAPPRSMLDTLYCGDTAEGEDPSLMAGSKSRLGRSNLEVLQLMDPRANPVAIDFEYPVYHHFKWDHCAAVGVTWPTLSASE